MVWPINDKEFDTKEILRKQIINSMGLPQYEFIIDNLKNINLTSNDKDAIKYRTTYNYFYRVRRNEIWREVYYEFFQRIKSNINIEFNEVLKGLTISLQDKGINTLEPSFASKLLATINPDKPIFDSRVLYSLKLDKEWEQNRSVDNAIKIYERICSWYNKFESTKKCDDCLRKFDYYVHEYNWIAKTKKIDFLLWNCGSNKYIS